MAWERNLRTVSKFQPNKKVNSLPSKKEALHRTVRRGGKGGGGGGGGGWRGRSGSGVGGGDSEGGKGEDGRPSIGTWATTQNYLKILKEISGKVMGERDRRRGRDNKVKERQERTQRERGEEIESLYYTSDVFIFCTADSSKRYL